MVGWAFNCSVKYPKRWKYWKVWLDYMLDVLDADWMERGAQDDPSGASEMIGEDEKSLLRKSLVVKYLSEAKGRSSAVKRVVRSAFADGSPDSLREFPEVFPNETKELKAEGGQKRKREHPIEQQYSDYDDAGAEMAMDSSELTDQTPEPSQAADNAPAADSWLGGTESVALRQRLLATVSSMYVFQRLTNASSFRASPQFFPTVSLIVLPFTTLSTNALNLFPCPPSLSFSRHPVCLSYQ
jgi:hypothetical protein